jgi:hypothetical protein
VQSHVVIGVELHRLADLAEVAGALDPVGVLPGPVQRGQQNRHQNGNDADDDKQFDQRESPGFPPAPASAKALHGNPPANRRRADVQI